MTMAWQKLSSHKIHLLIDLSQKKYQSHKIKHQLNLWTFTSKNKLILTWYSDMTDTSLLEILLSIYEYHLRTLEALTWHVEVSCHNEFECNLYMIYQLNSKLIWHVFEMIIIHFSTNIYIQLFLKMKWDHHNSHHTSVNIHDH